MYLVLPSIGPHVLCFLTEHTPSKVWIEHAAGDSLCTAQEQAVPYFRKRR
jgi:hypothetical protein